MISIFSDNKDNPKRKTTRRKRGNKNLSPEAKESLAKKNLDLINPMAIPLLVRARNERTNDWVESTILVLTESPYKLTEKWINSINKWVDSIVAAISLDEPDFEIKQRYDFGPFTIHKICDPSGNSQYPMPAIMAIDSKGWKFYFKTTKAYSFKKDEEITFTATVSDHKEGITFLRRPSKIKKVISIDLFGENDND